MKKSDKKTEKRLQRTQFLDDVGTVKRQRIEVSICIESLNKDTNSCHDSGKCKHETSLHLQEIT